MVLKNKDLDQSQCRKICRVLLCHSFTTRGRCCFGLQTGIFASGLVAGHGADRQRTQTSVPGRSSQWSTRGKNVKRLGGKKSTKYSAALVFLKIFLIFCSTFVVFLGRFVAFSTVDREGIKLCCHSVVTSGNYTWVAEQGSTAVELRLKADFISKQKCKYRFCGEHQSPNHTLQWYTFMLC